VARIGERMVEKKQKTKHKKEYLKYFKKMRARKQLPQKYGTWSRMKALGGSRQMRGQSMGLSESDALELAKKFGRKK